ncbi:MAG TPA: hypothetical protein VGB56_07135, partial [Flavisolibacter sp.]
RSVLSSVFIVLQAPTAGNGSLKGDTILFTGYLLPFKENVRYHSKLNALRKQLALLALPGTLLLSWHKIPV